MTDALARWREDELARMETPPAEVLERAPTYADVQKWPTYFIVGPGREVAEKTDCGHGYHLTDSCPCCGADEEDD
ncbi:hypothetical protein [Actinomadura oligospora]|uniref:hypothetical protein n=1 Tax=Actinomadura oligospora TaxID=111804 RepID=UPI0012F8ED9C|nr:hypothetical protein [Actinomadura oligospora]